MSDGVGNADTTAGASASLSPERIGLALAFLIVAWSPFSGGPRFPSVLLAFLGLWLFWKRRPQLFRARAQRRLCVVFALLLVPVLVSIPLSYAPRDSLNIAGSLLLFVAAGAAIVFSLGPTRHRLWFARGMTVLLGFWIADALLQAGTGTDLLGTPLDPGGRVNAPFAGTTMLPILLAWLTPIALSVLLSFGILPAALAFFVAALTALLSGVRTTFVWFGVLAAGLILRLPRWRLATLVLALAAGTLAVALSPNLRDRLPDPDDLAQPGFEKLDLALTQRLTIWHTALNMARDRPLTGVGAGAFEEAYARYATLPHDMFRDDGVRVYHAHQLYMGILAETGLAGLAGLLAIIALCLRWYWSADAAARDRAWPFALGLVIYAFPLNSQPVLYSLRVFPVLLLLLGGLLAALDDGKRPT